MAGLEPATSASQTRRSTRLSYTPSVAASLAHERDPAVPRESETDARFEGMKKQVVVASSAVFFALYARIGRLGGLAEHHRGGSPRGGQRGAEDERRAAARHRLHARPGGPRPHDDDAQNGRVHARCVRLATRFVRRSRTAFRREPRLGDRPTRRRAGARPLLARQSRPPRESPPTRLRPDRNRRQRPAPSQAIAAPWSSPPTSPAANSPPSATRTSARAARSASRVEARPDRRARSCRAAHGRAERARPG